MATITNPFSVQQLIGPDGPQTTGISLFLWLLFRIAAGHSRYTMPIYWLGFPCPGFWGLRIRLSFPSSLDSSTTRCSTYLLSRILFHASRCFFAFANNSVVSSSINMDSITSFC